MKTRKYLALLLLFLLVVSLAYIVSSQSASFSKVTRQQNRFAKQNCIPNNSFEEGSADFAVDWTHQNDTSMKIYRVDSVFCEGNYSYFIWSNTSVINACSEYFSIIPGSYYNVSYSAKTLFPLPETAFGYYLELLAKNSTSEKPYNWKFNETIFKICTIKAKSYGTALGKEITIQDEIDVLIINFGLSVNN